MFLSKIWFILIALVSAVAGTFALVAPRPAVQKLAALEGQRLDRAQYAAEQMFKVDAHKWIDRVSKLGRDAILSESLDAASRGSGEYTVIHRTIQDRFRTLIPDLASGGIDEIVATRHQGARHRPRRRRQRQGVRRLHRRRRGGGGRVARLPLGRRAGARAASWSAWPARRSCPRTRTGSSARSTSAPRPAPALVERLKKDLDVDVALLLRGKVIASSRNPGELDALPDMVAQHTSDMRDAQAHARRCRWRSGRTSCWSSRRRSPGRPASSRPTTRCSACSRPRAISPRCWRTSARTTSSGARSPGCR